MYFLVKVGLLYGGIYRVSANQHSSLMENHRPSVSSHPEDHIVIERLEAKSLEIPELKVFKSISKIDVRGVVISSYNKLFFQELGIDFDIVHENHCVSPEEGTMRGFHFQLLPYGQAKLIQVLRGHIYDVNVDLRKSSPTFGKHVAIELSDDGWNQIFVPVGFAHCYYTLEPHTEVLFKLGSPFAPTHTRGLAWNDPDLGIIWPSSPKKIIVIERDLQRPRFSELTDLFP